MHVVVPAKVAPAAHGETRSESRPYFDERSVEPADCVGYCDGGRKSDAPDAVTAAGAAKVAAPFHASWNLSRSSLGIGSPGGMARCAVTGLTFTPFFLRA